MKGDLFPTLKSGWVHSSGEDVPPKELGLMHTVIGIDREEGTVTTWSDLVISIPGVAGFSWYGPVADFRKQFDFLHL